MRTIPEFAAACRNHDRHLRGMVAFILVWWGGGAVALVLLMDRVEPPLADLLGETGGKVAAIALGLVAVFAPAFPVGWWVERRMKRIPGSDCPGCGKTVTRPGFREVAVATRSCPHCHVRLLVEPDPAPDVPLRSVDEVEALDRAGLRRATVWLAVGFVALVVGTAVYAGLTETVGGGRKRGLFGKTVDDPYTAAVLDLAVLLLLGFIPFILGTGRFLVLYRRTERRPEVRCPHCGGRLRAGLLWKTGNCGHCGRVAVSRAEGVG